MALVEIINIKQQHNDDNDQINQSINQHKDPTLPKYQNKQTLKIFHNL